MDLFWLPRHLLGLFGLPRLKRCTRCDAITDPIWFSNSGGLCGNCLADEALGLVRVANPNVTVTSHKMTPSGEPAFEMTKWADLPDDRRS